MNKDTSINTRYPQDVLEGMRVLAKQHERSFNSEVIWALRQYIKADKDKAMRDSLANLYKDVPLDEPQW